MKKIFISFLIIGFYFNSLLPFSEVSDSLEQAKYYYKTARSLKDSLLKFKNFDKAEKIALEQNEFRLLEKINYYRGYFYYNRGDYKPALLYFQKSYHYSQKHNIKNYSGYTLGLIGAIHFQLDNFTYALDTLNLAEEFFIKTNNTSELLVIYRKKASLYYSMNLFNLSLESLERAKQYATILNNKFSLARISERYGDIEKKHGNYSEAITHYKKALSIKWTTSSYFHFTTVQSYLYNKLGDTYYALKEYNKAEKYAMKAFLIADSGKSDYYSYSALLDYANLLVVQGKYKKAKKAVSKVDSLFSFIDNITLKRKFELSGDIFSGLNKPDSALAYFLRSKKIDLLTRRSLSFSDFRIGYSSYENPKYYKISKLFKEKYIKTKNRSYLDSVFKYININRAQTLSEDVKKQVTPSNSYKSAVNRIDHFFRSVRNEPTYIKSDQLDKLRQLKYNLVNSFVGRYKNIVNSRNYVSLQDYQVYLGKNNASSIEYVINEFNQFVLYLDSDQSKIIELKTNPKNIKKLVNTLINKFNQPELHDKTVVSSLNKQLYEYLWSPVEKAVSLKDNILIIPDLPVLGLPFDLLSQFNDSTHHYEKNERHQYLNNLLVHKYNFAYMPSAFLINSFKERYSDISFLGIANPFFKNEFQINHSVLNYTKWVFEPLPFSKKEVIDIAGYFDRKKILQKNKCTKNELLHNISDYSIIHFATHAFIDTIFDSFSGLVLSLSQDTTDSGFLMGYEINDLKMRSELVTLSACETGRGKIVGGEGIMGLPRLFFNAGAKSVLMSLWQVEDRFTSQFMPVFYKYYISDGMSKIEALGEAKRHIINNSFANGSNYSLPFYWSSFNLYGDISPIGKSAYYVNYLFASFILIPVFIFLYKKLKK